MSLLKALLGAGNGQAVDVIAKQLGLDNNQAEAGITQLLPALTRGMQKNISEPGGLDALLGALKKGNHGRYVDNPNALGDADSIADGNGILGHLLGSKDVSRQVAARASQNSGLDAGILKKMLPMIASLAMGSLAKQGSGGTLGGLLGGRQATEADGGLLSKFLDADGDGSAMDDLLGMARKFL